MIFNWDTTWIERTVQDMDDRQKRGEEEITLHIREFQNILMQLLAVQQRNNRLEDVLCSYAKCAFPINYSTLPPAVFGGAVAELTDSSKPNVSNTPQEIK